MELQDHHQQQMAASATTLSTLGHSWPALNRPLCSGQCLIGPDIPILSLTFALVVAIPATCAWTQQWVAWQVALNLIPIMVLEYLLLRASLTEPGIIPRPVRPAAPPSSPVVVDGLAAPLAQIGTHQISLHWCYTCLHWKPVRTHHCKEIDCCVLEMDHYCPWISNCIGQRNYTYYFVFVCLSAASGTFYFVIELLLCIHLLIGLEESDSARAIIAWGDVILIFMLLWALIPLAFYHAWLIGTGRTTVEHMKGVDMNLLYDPPRTCWQNYAIRLRRNPPPSLIDFNAICDASGRLVQPRPIIVIEPAQSMSVVPAN